VEVKKGKRQKEKGERRKEKARWLSGPDPIGGSHRSENLSGFYNIVLQHS
jgi:hypothetical protein